VNDPDINICWEFDTATLAMPPSGMSFKDMTAVTVFKVPSTVFAGALLGAPDQYVSKLVLFKPVMEAVKSHQLIFTLHLAWPGSVFTSEVCAT
jgi:hypothetical protein